MKYDIKAIPTTYAGVNFRSRLEARWAAFFDLCGWKWDYEPFDLEGWAPDFKLTIGDIVFLAEVKPFDVNAAIERAIDTNQTVLDFSVYKKALRHRRSVAVLLLGDAPITTDKAGYPIAIGVPTYDATDSDGYVAMLDALSPFDAYDSDPGDRGSSEATWREAGNIVQWNPDNNNRRYRTAA